MKLRIYNTLTRQKEVYKPLEGNTATIYSCGPTVYNYAHIGNLRTYIFMDSLRKVLRYNGYDLKHVMNITDVGHLTSDEDEGEDKMVKGAREQNKSPWEIAKFYTDIFMKDIAALGIETPEIVSKATDHINEMLEFVNVLVEKEFAYETSDGIYFDVRAFEDYGKLSGINIDAQMAGARVEVNKEKHHPADFAIWKKAPKEHIMQWESQWGMGYPGWHIECSAMSRKYLGDTFDIHTGGVDHIPVHHENEIAQSEAFLGKPAVKYWMHAEFMMVDNGKMSKSLGNTYTISDLVEKGFNPLAFRYMCLNAHYRSKLNFTWDSMQSAHVAYNRLREALLEHMLGSSDIEENILESFTKDFELAINDDLNIPKAMGVLWTMVRNPQKSQQIYQLAIKMDMVFGLNLHIGAQNNIQMTEVPHEVENLIEQRYKARKERNWYEADKLRGLIKELGYVMEDMPDDGYRVKKIN